MDIKQYGKFVMIIIIVISLVYMMMSLAISYNIIDTGLDSFRFFCDGQNRIIEFEAKFK